MFLQESTGDRVAFERGQVCIDMFRDRNIRLEDIPPDTRFHHHITAYSYIPRHYLHLDMLIPVHKDFHTDWHISTRSTL
jgi:hypothetical protein